MWQSSRAGVNAHTETLCAAWHISAQAVDALREVWCCSVLTQHSLQMIFLQIWYVLLGDSLVVQHRL
jgi:hypothetical protein